MNAQNIHRIFDVIETDIIPRTRLGVESGCKLFGAAILRKSDYSLVVAATNQETRNPLFHGEISAINDFYALKDHPAAKDCFFFATHEPCSLCLSGITWGGFDNFCYFFTYQDSRDAFKVPYDIDILEQVYRVPTNTDPSALPDEMPLYNANNRYFHSLSLKQQISDLNDAKLQERSEKITQLYQELSDIYQNHKGSLVLP